MRCWAIRIVAALLLVPQTADGQPQAPPAGKRTLHTISQIYSLPPAEAAKGYPIDIESVVTYSDGEWGQLFVQDATGNTYVNLPHSSQSYASGTRVRVLSVTGLQNGGVTIGKARIQVLGPGPQPKPVPLRIAEIDAGWDMSGWGSTEGVLHPCSTQEAHVCFHLVAGSKMLWASVRIPYTPAADKLIGATVRITGAIAGHVDAAGKRDGPQMFIPSLKEIEVLTPPLPENSPPTPIRSVLPEEADMTIVRPIHVQGRALWIHQGLMVLVDGTGAILVRSMGDGLVHLGDTVDVIGFPSHGEFGLELSDSAVKLAQQLNTSVSLMPQQSTAPEIIKNGLSGHRVHLEARLLSQNVTDARITYQLEDEDQQFEAIVLRHDPADRAYLPAGSRLGLTGVALVRNSNKNRPDALVVLLQSPSDILPSRDDGWLTWKRGLAILGAMVVCLIVPLIWVKQLRRTVQKQVAINRKQIEYELQLETKFRRIIERNLAAVYTWRSDGVILECNAAFVHLLGLREREEVIGRSYWGFEVHPEQSELLRNALEEGMLSNWDASLRRDDGTIVHLLENITPVETPEGIVYETTAIDVTQLRENQVELQKAKDAAVFDSLNDALTGLPNRRYLLATLPSLLVQAQKEKAMLGLLFIDLDGFKMVNDSLGHAAGDTLLEQVAASLRSMVRRGDTLARLGGDEFMVILGEIHSSNDAMVAAEALLNALSSPFRIEGHFLSIGASIGVSIYPEDGLKAEELMQQADNAMYAAKREGKNRAVRFTKAMGTQVQERHILENQLRGAIARKEIFLHFQPEFDMVSQRLIRFEALARWTNPVLGTVPPLTFIPIAEETRMILDLGAYIMEQACAAAVEWQKKSIAPIQVAVNVSSIQFRRKGFVEEVQAILDRTGLRHDLLQIEFTESVMLNGSLDTAGIMDRLRDLGISLAIDDFGTGYSNLSYLTTLPFDALKIDRTFVQNIGIQSGTETLIRTLTLLAHSFGMRVIVEGIETPQQLEFIRACGANEAQGYLLGRPSGDPLSVIRNYENAFLSRADLAFTSES